MKPGSRIVVIGLSVSSSWGNGHATTYRALLRALHTRGHEILFLECDRPWYAQHRDLPNPDFCRLDFYRSSSELRRWQSQIRSADLVIIGSYVVDGVATAELVRRWARLLAFYDIDTPVTLAKLERGETDYLSKETIPLFDLYFSFTGGPTLRVLEQKYGARSAHALYCAVDPSLYQPSVKSADKRWQLGYLGTYSADRQPTLDRLLLEPARNAPHLRFVVAGPQYPDSIAWPQNVERIEHLPPAEHASFYNDLAWTLNVTRADMIAAGYSPSVRLFEAAACATPIISDPWLGLGDFLEIGSEIVVAETGQQVLAILASPEQRRALIGTKARNRILQAHTAEHRALALEGAVDSQAVTAMAMRQLIAMSEARQGVLF